MQRFRDCQISEKRFTDEFRHLRETLKQNLQRRSEKAKRKHVQMSQAVATQEAEEKEDEKWSRIGSNTEVEARLRNDLNHVFTGLGIDNNVKALACIRDTFSGEDDMIVMSYATFNNFVKGQSQSRNGLKPRFRKILQAFVSRKTVVSVALAAAGVTAGVGDSDKEQYERDYV
jgi:hypothetical protein